MKIAMLQCQAKYYKKQCVCRIWSTSISLLNKPFSGLNQVLLNEIHYTAIQRYLHERHTLPVLRNLNLSKSKYLNSENILLQLLKKIPRCTHFFEKAWINPSYAGHILHLGILSKGCYLNMNQETETSNFHIWGILLFWYTTFLLFMNLGPWVSKKNDHCVKAVNSVSF